MFTLMLLPLDHIPFVSRDDTVLCAFMKMGFTCSPLATYTSPEFPDVIWKTNCVFLNKGWFDLLRDMAAPVESPTSPGGCIFLSDGLPATVTAISNSDAQASYTLIRQWSAPESATEIFKVASYRNRVCQFPLTIIEHDWPCRDIKPGWQLHANSAVSLDKLTRCVERQISNPDTSLVDRMVDTSQTKILEKAEFQSRFHTERVNFSISILVSNLAQVKKQLNLSQVTSIQQSNRVLAYPEELDCVFEFTNKSDR